jgi:PAS domain S-box-containing protein
MEAHSESSVGLFTTDVDLTIRIWDSALERMTGIASTDAIGRHVLDVIPDLRDRPAVVARFDQALRDGTIEVLSPALHRYLIRCLPSFDSKYFSEMRQQVRIAPLREEEIIRGIAITIEDVTRRMEDEMELVNALRDSDETVRLEASREISGGSEPLIADIAAPVIDALGDPSWKVRRNLVDGLAKRGAPDAIAALLRALRDKHLHFGVVNGALQILRSSSVDTSGTLVEFLRSTETDMRIHSALALGEQNDPRVIPALISALDDEDANVRYHVIEALGKLKAVEAVELLISIAESEDFFLSFAALDALAEIGDPKVAARVAPLIQNEMVREAAVRALGRTGGPSDIADIVSQLNDDGRLADTIAHAALALYERHQAEGEVGENILRVARESINDNGIAHLADALKPNSRHQLSALIRFSGWFPDSRISERLCSLMETEEYREQAVAGLLLQGETAVAPLIQCLSSDEEEVRRYAARTLGRIGDARAIEPLVELLEEGITENSAAAIDALGGIATPESAKVLLECLDDPDARIREAAVRVLGRLGEPRFADAVLAKSNDANETVRYAAIEQIPVIAGHEGLSAIVSALDNDTPRVRAAAVRALSQIDHQDSIELLRKALNDQDPWTRYFAVRGIGAHRDTASLEKLNELTSTDPAEQVRVAATEVTGELGKQL